MLTFNGSQQLKDELLVKLKHHQDLDTFIQGTWLTNEKVEGNGYKGCFYGCTMQSSDDPIEQFSKKYNIDLWYCFLTEKLFENLPDGVYQKFPYDSIKILPVGFDFNILKSKFHKVVLLKQLDWIDYEPVRECLIFTSKLFDVPFNEITEKQRSAAESAAESAARSAESAAESAAWSAARSAAESAESAAWSAAWSAESAAWSAWSAARSAAWSAAESAESAWSAWSAWSAARSAESAARSAARSAAESAESAWSAAEIKHYLWLRETLFNLIQECSNII